MEHFARKVIVIQEIIFKKSTGSFLEVLSELIMHLYFNEVITDHQSSIRPKTQDILTITEECLLILFTKTKKGER